MKIGYACIPLTINASTNRRIMLKDFSEKKIIETIKENLRDLHLILIHNVKNNIFLFRISSDIIPLGSHEINTFPWEEYFKGELDIIGQYIKSNNIRVSMHPGQYTVLNSPTEEIVNKSIRDLEYHCKFLDSLGVDYSNKIILHIGGVYGDKSAAINRFINNFQSLSPSLKKRLVIENDEKSYSIDDVLNISKIIKIPVIFDNLHNECHKDNLYSLDEIFKRVCSTWEPIDGPMKVHYSQQDITKKEGSHSKTIFIDKFLEYYTVAKKYSPDIMLEVKDKDISAIKCINSVNELNNSLVNENIILDEWSKYQLSVLECNQDSYFQCDLIANTSSHIIPLYKAIDESFITATMVSSYKLALDKAIETVEFNLSSNELKHIYKLISEEELIKAKIYLEKISLRKNLNDLLDTYYFS